MESLLDKMNTVLDSVRPHLEADGGDVHVVKVTEDHVVHIEWSGNCMTCSMSAMTLKAGIEETLKSKFPQIQSVIAVNGLSSEAR